MKNKKIIIIALLIGVLIRMTYATDYQINPMNFPIDESRNHRITVSSPGDAITVSIPSEFTLISGTPNATGSVDFTVSSPNSSTNGDIFEFDISLNSTYHDTLYVLSVPDDEIVDNKWELGHGNFNYPECQYLPDDPSLIFPIIRVWGVGTDVLDEVARNVSFTCDYPKIRPRTVDSKYTTDYSDPSYLIANGFLDPLEGFSLFRVFVLSQEVDYNVGQNYEVTCSNLEYEFEHHTVNASIPDINISIVDPDPFVITTSIPTDHYIQYNILHNGSYEVRDLEFEWQTDNFQVHRKEKSVMYPGDIVVYRVWTNDNPNVTLTIRQKPCWMFNSRDPTYYEQSHSGSYSVNSNSTSIFSVEEAIYYKFDPDITVNVNFTALDEKFDEWIFLFKINQEHYYVDVNELSPSQQNEANFTCYRLDLRSNGFNLEPEVMFTLENATLPSQVIVKDELFQTKEFDFDIDPDGVAIVKWDQELGACTEDLATSNFECPTTYNYICVGSGVGIKKEAIPESPDCFFCREKMLEIGSKFSPTYPAIGFLVLIGLIFGGIYMYYYYQDEVDLRNWIQGSKQKREREKFLKYREEERQRRIGGGLF
jgi:hypothetical protein